jgi:hypothetical protein
MKNPLKCPVCSEFRYLKIEGVKFEKGSKKVGIKVPYFFCKKCGNKEPIELEEYYQSIADKHFHTMKEGELISVEFEYENKKFKQYEHLNFLYDSIDYYLIPGLYRGWNDGFLTPVFFDKDLLLYYNNHPDYAVRLHSFSSGNIYFKEEPLLKYGFGINRSGKIFSWLGDLDNDFKKKDMIPHLKRFQASNIASDHDVFSKFYLSQIPSNSEEMFQDSDNETKLFRLFNEFVHQIKTKKNTDISLIDIDKLEEYYKYPILEENQQIFNAYLSLNKYLVENFQVHKIKEILTNNGIPKKNISNLGSLKTFQLFLQNIIGISDIDKLISPLYVLNDLRQLQGHLMDDSYKKEYNFCKGRLTLASNASDFEVYKKLIEELIKFYETIQLK